MNNSINQEKRFKELEEQASAFLDQNDPDSALKLWKTALLDDPDDPAILFGIASLYSIIGDYGKSRDYYIRASENDPENYIHIFEIGNTYYREGTYDRALVSYHKAMDLSSGNPGILFAIGKVFMILGIINEAIANFEEVRRKNPLFPGVNLLLGNIYSGLEEYGLAFKCYIREIEVNPDETEAYKNIGFLCLNEGRENEAREYFDRVRELDPADYNLFNYFIR